MAYSLAREGAEVHLIESGRVGGGATNDAFGWVGLSASAPDTEQAALRRVASVELDRLAGELPLPFSLRRSGALSWSAERGDPDSVAATGAAWGSAIRVVDRAEIGQREPGLRHPPDAAVLAEQDGSVDPVAFTVSLQRGAQDLGAVLSEQTHVHDVLVADGRVRGVRTSSGTVDVDTVVLAAGTGTPALASALGVTVPVASSPCILMRFTTSRPLLNGIVSGPDFELRQAGETTLLAAEDYIDDSPENGPAALAALTLDTIRREIAGSEDVALTDVAVGLRPIPADGRPIIGTVEPIAGLYIVSAHAGIALAAGIGRLAAEEIMHDSVSEILSPFRPARFPIA